MKVLIVQVGTPVNPGDYSGEQLIREPTLTHGLCYFRYSEVVNNVQTRESLKAPDIQVDHIYFTGRKNPVNCVKAAWRLRKMVKQNRYDVVNQYWGWHRFLFLPFMVLSGTLYHLTARQRFVRSVQAQRFQNMDG